MPNCQMCWNEWGSLERVGVPGSPESEIVCRNCNRTLKQATGFLAHLGFTTAQPDEPPRPPTKKADKAT